MEPRIQYAKTSDGVNMAARIASKAEGGEILVADVVRQLVAGKKFLFNDSRRHGAAGVRGGGEDVRS